MATVTVTKADARHLPRWVAPAIYLALIVVAEVALSIQVPGDPPAYPYQALGYALHVSILFALLFHSTFVSFRDRPQAYLLMATSFAPLIRILSLSLPHADFPILVWLAIISVPLLGAVGSVAYVQRLRPRDLGLTLDLRSVWIQVAVGLTGVPLGFIEYLILRPSPWSMVGLFGGLAAAALIIFFATGLPEELAFRGILLRRAVDAFGERKGLAFTTIVFASLHIFYLNLVDLVFVLVVGLFYGIVVLRTRSLWGAIISHTIDNVVLYLLAPQVISLTP